MDLFDQDPSFAGARQLMQAFALSQIRPVAAKHDLEESMPWDLMRTAHKLGLRQTALIDVAKTGSGPRDPNKPKTGARLAVIGSEEIAWGCAGIGLALAGSGLAASPVARLGNSEQKQFFIESLRGEDENGRIKVAAMALSEPSTGSDISSLSTSAQKTAKGWALNGQKQWITNGQSASIYVVWAQTDQSLGRQGVRGFLVPRETPGLIPGRKETKLGIRASETASVTFEDCRIPDDYLLGSKLETSEGLGDTKKMLDSTRPMVAAQAVGIARAAFDFTTEKIKAGECPGASNQSVAFLLAEMAMEIEASRALTHKAAWFADHGRANVALASMAKAHAARTAQWVTKKALLILGEEALSPGHPVEKWYRDAKIYDIFEGTGQIQRRIIARHLTGKTAI